MRKRNCNNNEQFCKKLPKLRNSQYCQSLQKMYTTKDLNNLVSEFDDHISIKRSINFFQILTSKTLTLKLSL